MFERLQVQPPSGYFSHQFPVKFIDVWKGQKGNENGAGNGPFNEECFYKRRRLMFERLWVQIPAGYFSHSFPEQLIDVWKAAK